MRSDDPVCVLFCSGKVLFEVHGVAWQLSFAVRPRRVWRRRCPVRRGWFGGALSSESFADWRRDAPHMGKELLVEAGVRLRMAL